MTHGGVVALRHRQGVRHRGCKMSGKRRRQAFVAVAAVGLALSASASAEEWKFRLGAGVGFAPDYEGSEDYQAVPLLTGKAEKNNYYAELIGTKLRGNVVPSDMWRAGPQLDYRFKRNNVDNDRVDDLRTVDEAWELGAFGGFTIKNSSDKRYSIGADLDVSKDVASGHSGWLIGLNAKYSMPLSDEFQFTFGAGGTWADNNYMDEYFSIDSDNAARSGLREFSADSGLKDIGGNLRLDWKFYGGWSASFLASIDRLLGDAEDSPIVDDEGSATQGFGGALIAYSW